MKLGTKIHEQTKATRMDLFICLIPKVDRRLWRDIKVNCSSLVCRHD